MLSFVTEPFFISVFRNYRHFQKKHKKFAIKTEIEKSPTVGNRLKIYVIAQKPVLSVIKKICESKLIIIYYKEVFF
jgi:hypothetical protein